MKQRSITELVGRHKSLLNSSVDLGLWHPLSYYVLGGSDPTGENLREINSTGFDSDDMIDQTSVPDSRTNARLSKWDIIESIGVSAYENILDKTVSETKPSSK